MALAPPNTLVPNASEGKKGFMGFPFKPVALVKPANLAISANEGGGDICGMPADKFAMDANEGSEGTEEEPPPLLF